MKVKADARPQRTHMITPTAKRNTERTASGISEAQECGGRRPFERAYPRSRRPLEGSSQMTDGPEIAGSLRGVTFHQRDLSGAMFDTCTLEEARFRDCNLSGVRIVASYVEGLRVSSLHGEGARVVVDDVDVSEFVAAELDRRFPERVALRSLSVPDDYRAVFATLEARWDETLQRAERLPEPARDERVDGEWSLVETLRHLVFADDCWITRQYYETDDAFHPLGVPPTDCPPDQHAELGLADGAHPAYAEVVGELRDRRTRLRELLAGLTEADLERPRTAVMVPVWGEETHAGGECLRVLLQEYSAHRRYAERDLAILETGVA
jgi:hypothetical protein